MVIFIDTSAFVALMVTSDQFHQAARDFWQFLLQERATLVTNNYVMVETLALIQRRQGMKQAQFLQEHVFPLVACIWVTEAMHQMALDVFLRENRRDLSVVDCTSFVAMRARRLTQVFTFDAHFDEQGFAREPAA